MVRCSTVSSIHYRLKIESSEGPGRIWPYSMFLVRIDLSCANHSAINPVPHLHSWGYICLHQPHYRSKTHLLQNMSGTGFLCHETWWWSTEAIHIARLLWTCATIVVGTGQRGGRGHGNDVEGIPRWCLHSIWRVSGWSTTSSCYSLWHALHS